MEAVVGGLRRSLCVLASLGGTSAFTWDVWLPCERRTQWAACVRDTGRRAGRAWAESTPSHSAATRDLSRGPRFLPGAGPSSRPEAAVTSQLWRPLPLLQSVPPSPSPGVTFAPRGVSAVSRGIVWVVNRW